MRAEADRSLVPLACGIGAVALVAQTVLARELMVSFYGTELALASALSCWLLFVPLGALSGAVVLRVVRRPRWAAQAALLALVAGLLVQFPLARLVRPMLGVQVGEFPSVGAMLRGAALAALPAAFPVGFFFPVAAAVEEARGGLPAGGISRIYVAEALGSGVTGALLSFCLLGRHEPIAIVVAASVAVLLVLGLWSSGAGGGPCAAAGAFLAGLLCWSAAEGQAGLFFAPVALAGAAGLGVAWAARGRHRLRVGPLAVGFIPALGLCALFLGWGARLGTASAEARWDTFSLFRRVDARDTRYQLAEVGERAGEFVVVQDGQPTVQFPDPASVRRQAALLLTQHEGPQYVLVVGGGLGGLCQEMLRAPLRRLDYVEADPQLLDLVRRHLPPQLAEPLADPRFAAYGFDGRHFVGRAAREPQALAAGAVWSTGARAPAGSYDLVVLNVGDPTSASASRFYTVEFFREVARVLRPGGALAVCGVTGSDNYVRGTAVLAYGACIYGTVRSVFPWIVVRPGGELCLFAAAGPGVVTADVQVLVGRFERLGLQPELLKYAFELSEFPPERVEWVETLLEEARPTAMLNRDARPVVFTLFLRVQSHFAGRRLGAPRRGEAGPSLLERVRGVGAPWLGAPFGLLLGLVALVRALGGRRRAVAWACGMGVFTTGAFGLSAEMLVVYSYQTHFGYVYRDVALVVGLFMLGLALGGWLTHRLARARPGRALLGVEVAQAALMLAVVPAGRLLSFSPYAFMLLSPAAGLLTGAEFPLASRQSLLHGARSGTVAGAFDALDHLGALVGAACAGLLLVPAIGLVQTAALLALVKCFSLAGLLIAFFPAAALPPAAGSPT